MYIILYERCVFGFAAYTHAGTARRRREEIKDIIYESPPHSHEARRGS